MSEHLKTLNGNEKDPNKIRDAAKAMKENLPKLKESVHRDELRELRTSVEKHLKEQSQEDTKTALTELRDELAKHAIDEPILPRDSGKKAAEVMPDMLKPATEKTVDGANEALQRTYEEGKHLAKKVEGSEVYQEGKKRVEGFLEEAKEKGTFTAVKDRMQDMWENGGAGGKILVGTGLVAAGYLTYKALSWLWEKLEEGSVLAWGAVTAGVAGLGAYWYMNRETPDDKKRQEDQQKAAKAAQEKFKDKKTLDLKDIMEAKEPLDLTTLGKPMTVERGTRKAEVQLVKQGNETLMRVNGKSYRAETEVPVLGKQNLSEKLKFALKYPGNNKLHAATVPLLGDMYVDMDALTNTILTLSEATQKKTEQDVEYWMEDKGSKENVLSHKNQKLAKKMIKVTFEQI